MKEFTIKVPGNKPPDIGFSTRKSRYTGMMQSKKNSIRKPWLAAAYSMLLPGLGQLYANRIDKALLLFCGFLFVSVFSGSLIVLYLPHASFPTAMLVTTIITILLYLYIVFDAYRLAEQNSIVPVQRWERVAFYPVIIAIGWFLVFMPLTQYVRNHFIEVFTVPSRSMVPTILPGDLLIADKRVHCRNCPQAITRGQIVTFVFPNDRRLRYIKRVIGLPGDHIRLAQQQLWINNQPLTRSSAGNAAFENNGKFSYSIRWAPEDLESGNWHVPQGHIFVLGDNRSHSLDSRNFGSIPLRDVVGSTNLIGFSYSKESGFRWNRVGKTIQ